MLFDFVSAALDRILVTLDSPALAPIFVSLTGGMNEAERKRVAIRAIRRGGARLFFFFFFFFFV